MTPKYEITRIVHPKFPWMHRIRALRNVREDVRAGDLGGFVQSERNLSQEGTCWIADNAIAAEEACVTGHSLLSDNAWACGHAAIFDRAIVSGNAVLDTCEYARYAPGSNSDQEMGKVYTDSIDVITKLDKAIR